MWVDVSLTRSSLWPRMLLVSSSPSSSSLSSSSSSPSCLCLVVALVVSVVVGETIHIAINHRKVFSAQHVGWRNSGVNFHFFLPGRLFTFFNMECHFFGRIFKTASILPEKKQGARKDGHHVVPTAYLNYLWKHCVENSQIFPCWNTKCQKWSEKLLVF